jgi:hypothetical protein
VVEVTAQNLAGLHGRKVDSIVDADASTIGGNELRAVALYVGSSTVKQNAADFGNHESPLDR